MAPRQGEAGTSLDEICRKLGVRGYGGQRVFEVREPRITVSPKVISGYEGPQGPSRSPRCAQPERLTPGSALEASVRMVPWVRGSECASPRG
jgi:hypothetical protein